MLEKAMACGIYIVICILTLAAAFFLVDYFDALAYDVVTIFIALIVLSNCLAKLYSQYILRQDV